MCKNRVDESSIIVYNAREAIETNHKEDAYACVLYVRGEYMTNSSLRKRLGLEDTSSGTSSRIIREAVAKGLIKPFDPNTAPRYMKYMPAWG